MDVLEDPTTLKQSPLEPRATIAPVRTIPMPDSPRQLGTLCRSILPAPQSVKSLLAAICLLAALAVLSSHFYRQYAHNESFQPTSFDWRAEWIASPYSSSPTACFRKTFDLTGNTRSAYLVMTADTYYRLSVNGREPNPDFRAEAWSSLPKSQTPYSQLGYPRKNLTAHIYNLTPYLRPGSNVIAVLVQTDQGVPHLLAQAHIETVGMQDIITDDSWKCAPCEQKNHLVSWVLPQFWDIDWPAAVPTGAPVTVPVDGDPSLYETPVIGSFISGDRAAVGGVTRFRRTVICPAAQRQGWLRLAANTPYDVYLNGQPIKITSLTNQYTQSLLVRGGTSSVGSGDFFTFGRIQHASPVTEYAPASFSPKISEVLLRRVFRPGANQLEIVLHGDAVVTPRPQVLFYLQGNLTLEDGSIKKIITDQSWESRSDGEAAWHPAYLGPSLSGVFLNKAGAYVRDRLDSTAGLSAYDSQMYWPDIRTIVLFFLGFLLLSAAISAVLRYLRPCLSAGWLAGAPAVAGVPTVVLTGAFLLQLIFFPSPQKTQFGSAEFAGQALLTAAVAGSLTLLAGIGWALSVRAVNPGQARRGTLLVYGAGLKPRKDSAWRRFTARYGYAFGLGVVMTVAAVVYLYHLGANDYLPDEYTTLMAARGILQHGIPLYPSHIIYPRSVIYHYLLALIMWLTGSTTAPLSSRLLAGLWTIALLPVVYLFGRELRGRAVGLVSAAVTAFSPFMIFYAHEARFYTQFSFFATLMVYFLYKSVRHPQNSRYRAATILAYAASYLSQEFSITMILPTALVIVLARQLPAWMRWTTLRWIALAFLCMLAEIVIYAKFGQTPLMSIDTDTMLLMAFHTDKLELLLSMLLVGSENSHLLIGLFYVAGLLWTFLRLFRRPASADGASGPVVWVWWNYLYLFTGVTCLLTTLLTPRPTNRYIIHMFPCVVLTAVAVAFRAGELIRQGVQRLSHSPRLAWCLQATFIACLTILAVAQYRPLRVWNTISEMRRFNRGTTEASGYVEAHWQKGDKIILFSPDIGSIHFNQADYFWRSVPNSIFVYRSRDGLIRERDTGAVDVDSVDKLRRIISDNPRVWLIIPRKNITTGSHFNNGLLSQFTADNFQVRRETLGMEVLLWDRQRNHYYSRTQEHGDDELYL